MACPFRAFYASCQERWGFLWAARTGGDPGRRRCPLIPPNEARREWYASAPTPSGNSRGQRPTHLITANDVASISPTFGAEGWKLMLFGEDVGVKVRHPQLALLRHAKVAERITNVGRDHRPKELRVHGPQPCRAIVACTACSFWDTG